MADKTHDPTPKRVREARAKGDVPYAPLVAAGLGCLLLPALGAPALQRWQGLLHAGLRGEIEPDAFALARATLSLASPPVLALAAVAVVSAIAQGSVTASPAKLALDPSRLDLIGGLARLVDRSRAWSAARGLFATVLLGVVLSGVVRGVFTARGAGGPLPAALAAGSRVLIAAGITCLALAVLDVWFARRIWLGRHRMSRDEVMREHRESEGDPELRRTREELHHELLAAEAVSAVRGATVVVVNPTHLACALRYEGKDDDEAPVLVAKGSGALAAQIVAAARAYGVPVVEDIPVARALIALEVGSEIPEALYEAVAEVLSMAGATRA